MSLQESLRHAHIVTLLDVFIDGGRTQMVLDVEGQPLGALILSQTFQASQIQRLVRQMILAVHYLHAQDIIHCNLEPQNMLVNATSLLQVTGFEDARIEREGFRHEIPFSVAAQDGLHVGRLEYRAPEILLGDTSFSFPVDLWSIGCVMWELAVNSTVFQGSNFYQVMMMISSSLVKDDQDVRELRHLPHWKKSYGMQSTPSTKWVTLAFEPAPGTS